MSLDADKRLAFETTFDKGRVFVVIDITDPKVILPDIARARSPNGRHLPIHYSRTFVEANIKVTDTGLVAKLAFGGPNMRHQTFVPWSAIMAIIQNGIVLEQWPDVPISFYPKHDGPTEQILVETVSSDTPDDPNAMTAAEMKWFVTSAVEA